MQNLLNFIYKCFLYKVDERIQGPALLSQSADVLLFHPAYIEIPTVHKSFLIATEADMKDEMNAAIAAHGQWKQRLNDAIETGKSEFSPVTIKLDNQCAFGKWLHGTISAQEKLSPYYAQALTLHAQFHSEVGKILELALAGKKEEAKKLVAFGSAYASISSKLVNLLMKWGQD